MRRIITILQATMLAALLSAPAARSESAGSCQELMKQAMVEQQRSLWVDAAKTFAAAAELATNDAQRAQARLGWGRNLVSAGDPSAGRAILATALEGVGLGPNDRASALEAIGAAHYSERAFTKAVDAYVQITLMTNANVANQARGWSKIGEVHYALGDYPAARAAWEKALAIPGVASIHVQNAWTGMGDSFMAEARWEEARAAYARVLLADNADAPTKLCAEIGAGNALYEAGNYPEACKAYLALAEKNQAPLRVIERLDTIFRMQMQKAGALLAAGKYAEARVEFAKVFDMERVEDHHRATAQLGIGQSLEGTRQFAAARAEYARVPAMPGAHWPDQGRAQMGIARCFEAEGNRQAAREAYAKLVDMPNISGSDRAAAEARIKMPQ